MRNAARANGKTLWPWRTRTRMECSSPTAYRHAATRSQKTLDSILFLHLRFYDGERIANDPGNRSMTLAARKGPIRSPYSKRSLNQGGDSIGA